MDPWVGNAFVTSGTGITLTEPDTVSGGVTVNATGGSGTVTGSGTINVLPKWTSTGGALGNSLVTDTGSLVTVTDGAATWLAVDTGNFFASVGVTNVITGSDSYAFGERNTVDGNDASAFGEQNVVSGNDASAFGEHNTVEGSDASALGKLNTVTGNSAYAIGEGNTVSGSESVAVGLSNVTSGGSYVLGNTLADAGFATYMLGAFITADRDGVHLGYIHTGLICTSSATSVPTGQLFQVVDAASGTFTTVDLKTVTVAKGIITSITT